MTRSWLTRVDAADGPLARQVLPHASELAPSLGDVGDPVGESGRSPVPWVVQKHADRVLIQVTRRCHLYCRYCFRRDQRPGQGGGEEPDAAALTRAIDFARTSGAREVILSGGDPLTLPDARLLDIIDRCRPDVPVVRIHSRAPITAPSRVTPALVRELAQRAPVWMVVHCNHPDELGPDVRLALRRMVDAGLPVLNQAVMLAGVNDDVDVLERLCSELVKLRAFPYYLHHTDPVPGNSRFRVDLARGLELHAALARRVSGVALPRYVVDPPDGSGKVDASNYVLRRAGKQGEDPASGERGPRRSSDDGAAG